MRTNWTLLVTMALSSVALAATGAGGSSGSSSDSDLQEIIVTARVRQESLKDVPIAVTAITGDTLQEHQIIQLKDIAQLTPGLNINSDSATRTFVTMRGIGTTLIDSVQPGVGIFIDGIYQPNTTYLSTPLVDVARVEVLRGPQGTLFGNNTLGGAINVITQAPTNDWKGRIDGAYAGPDHYESFAGSISGPIIPDVLLFRLGAAFHNQDNFQTNTIAGGNTNPLCQSTLNGTVLYRPSDWATFTINANFDRVRGGLVPYGWSRGPRDYTLNVGTNVNSIADIYYTGANIKGEFEVIPKTKLTTVLAYNKSDTAANGTDADFGPVDLFRANGRRVLETSTAEFRFDTAWTDNVSTLIGVFGDRYTSNNGQTTFVVPLGDLALSTDGTAVNTSEAIFGTVFWKLAPSLDLAVGLRYDHQRLTSSTAAPGSAYKNSEVEPRVTLTKHWDERLMTYASVSKGARGGGQNDPGAPNPFYKGDSVWTYELGTKFTTIGGRLSVNADIFYNNYKDYIGINAIAPSTLVPGLYVSVNLNEGDVKSYGAELEADFRVTDHWKLYGNFTRLHARVTNQDEFIETTGYALPGDNIFYVPDWNFTTGTHYRIPFAGGDDLFYDLNVVAKGKRTGASLDADVEPVLDHYYLTNTSLAWHHKALEVALFGTNIFNSKYVESYLDASILGRAQVPAAIVHSLSLQGQGARYGIRFTQRF